MGTISPRVDAVQWQRIAQNYHKRWKPGARFGFCVRRFGSLPVFGGAAAALAVQVFVQLVSRVMQIAFIYDVVPFESSKTLRVL